MLVLMYHRVAAPAHDPFALAVSPQHFVQHVEWLQQQQVVAPLLDWFSGSSAPRVALTFDDGYLDNAVTAAPLVQEAGLPVTWFLTTDTLGGGRFWWDVLTDAVLTGTAGPWVRLTVDGRRLWVDLRTHRSRLAALVVVRRRLKPLPPDVLAGELAAVVAACGAPPAGADGRTMSREQARALADADGAEVGAHTRTHAMLARQSPDRQREEVIGSVEAVAELTGRPVRAFAYPFGGAADVGPLAPRLAAEAGCLLACATSAGVATRDKEPLGLPRLAIGDWDGAEFASRVTAALGRS